MLHGRQENARVPYVRGSPGGFGVEWRHKDWTTAHSPNAYALHWMTFLQNSFRSANLKYRWLCKCWNLKHDWIIDSLKSTAIKSLTTEYDTVD